MKIRKGFVSNSSGSSFICAICNHSEYVHDMALTEAGFAQCENEHVFCEEHLLDGVTSEDLINDDYIGECYPDKYCPICQFQEYSQPEMAEYLNEKYNISRDEVFSEIKKVNKRRKKLYNYEYIEHVLKTHNLTDDIVLTEIKNTFKTYKNFLNRNIK